MSLSAEVNAREEVQTARSTLAVLRDRSPVVATRSRAPRGDPNRIVTTISPAARVSLELRRADRGAPRAHREVKADISCS